MYFQINWYVILQTEDILLTYDCSTSYEKEVQYGIHFYSRQPHVTTDRYVSTKLDNIIQFYGGLMNPANINPVYVSQQDCEVPAIKNADDVEVNVDLLRLGMDFIYY